ncbi:EAL domain-containing protein [Vibrio sp. WJH972]
MKEAISLVTNLDFVSEAQKISDALHYNHIDIVLAFNNESALEKQIEEFASLGELQTVRLVGEVKDALYAVYLCVPRGSNHYASTIQQTIKQFFKSVKVSKKSAYKFLTSSKIGISVLGGDCVNFQTAVIHAFQATMAQENKQNKRVTFFDTKLQSEIKRQVLLEDVVRVAVDNDDVNIVYQPIISTRSWAIEGYEILSRFPADPVLKTNTRELISICEDQNLISELDLLTYHKALLELKPYINSTHAFLNINLSTNTRESFSDLIDCVDFLTRQNKLSYSRLVVDVNSTRDQFKVKFANDLSNLRRLAEKGSAIALADLSSGFDIENQLAEGSYRYLRLDDRFKLKFHDDSNYYQVVKLIVKVCHGMGVKVIVEGVESVEQARVLVFLGIDFLQGPLFTLPAKIEEFGKLPERINLTVEQILQQADDSDGVTSDLLVTNIGSIATQSLPRIDPSATISLAYQYFTTESISVLPVVDNKECVGIVERAQLNLFLSPTMGTNLETEKESRMWRRPINSVMDVKFHSVDETLDIESLLTLLKEKTYQLPLVVTRRGEYTGILTECDLIDYLVQKEL